MINLIYRFNKWLDRSPFTLLYLMMPIILANFFTFLTDYILIGAFFWVIMLLLTFFRIGVQSNLLKFNHTKYNIPEVGERVIIKKEFYWNGEFHKNPPRTDFGNKPWYFTIRINDEFIINEVNQLGSDWIFYMEDKSGDKIHIKYFESRKYWETKSDIRNNKLEKLGI